MGRAVEILTKKLIAGGCDPVEAAVLVSNLVVEISTKQRSKHAEAQARYQAKRAAAKEASEMIRNDQNDQNDQGVEIPPPATTSNYYPPPSVTSLRSVTDAPSAASPDPRQELFHIGLPMLQEITGKPSQSCRSLLGRWLKVVDDEAIHVLGMIAEARDQQIADPVPWIESGLRNLMGKRRHTFDAFVRPTTQGQLNTINLEKMRAKLKSTADDLAAKNFPRDSLALGAPASGTVPASGDTPHPRDRKRDTGTLL